MAPNNKPAEEIKTFFASGSKGNEVRADGQGGFLKRGHYWRDEKGNLHGPFSGARIRNLSLKRHAAVISEETGDLALIEALSGCRTESGARAYTSLYNAAQRLGEINRIARAALSAARKES